MTACFFGRYLLDKSLVTEGQLSEALALQMDNNLCIGDMAVAADLLTTQQVAKLNDCQRQCDILIGDLAVQEGLLSTADLERLTSQQHYNNISIGEALIQVDAIKRHQLPDLLSDYHFCRARAHDECVVNLRDCREPLLVKTFVDEMIKAFKRFCHMGLAMASVDFDVQPIAAELLARVRLKHGAADVLQLNIAVGAEGVSCLSDGFVHASTEFDSSSVTIELCRLLQTVSHNVCEQLKARGRELSCESCELLDIDGGLPSQGEFMSVSMATEACDFQLMLLHA
jgi:hypothetical protein